MNCPHCGKPGFTPQPIGRPKLLDDAKVRRLREKGKSLSEIGHLLGVTKQAIHFSLKRAELTPAPKELK